MDPFAPDSDPEDERVPRVGATDRARLPSADRTDAAQGAADPYDLERSHVSAHDSLVSSRHSIEDNEGPPASIVLDTHDEHEASGSGDRGDERAQSSRAYAQSAARSADPHTVSESVRLSRIGAKQRAGGNDQEYLTDDEEEDNRHFGGALNADDEEAGLIASPPSRHSNSASSRSSRRRATDQGMFGRLAQKVRRNAERIRAQDSIHAAASSGHASRPVPHLNAKERALWKWGTLENMDEFLQEVYGYYIGKGLVCILLAKVLNLLTIAFVIIFSTFLVGCIDYSAIKHDGKLADIVVDQCFSRFSGLTVLAFILFVAMYSWQVVRFGLGISKLIEMRNFYIHLLNIPDADVQAISWHEVVSRIAHLRETNPTLSLSSSHAGNNIATANASKLDAHDVANRIMRQENYLVALFNKDVLNLKIPFLPKRAPELTRTLEWNLTFCLLGFLFDNKGQVRRQFVTERHRKDLIEGLKRRFIFMAVINAIFAPFIVIYLLFYFFFRYFEEYHKNPSYLGARQYTQFARWKFREFNELPHIFRRRCHNSYTYAQRYIDQFPKERTAIVARFVSFVAGSFTAVLLLASVIDPDLFLHFDITPQRNVLFYIGVFGVVLAVSRAMVPDEQQVFEPEVLLRAVIEYTHYVPEHWKGRFHSAEVHAEFGQMYRLKINIFVVEILSVLFTPFILWKSLPNSAPAIVDFFREFTVHVDGLGYVCSFAVFDFKRHGNVNFGAPNPIADARMSSNEGKMEQSLLGFRAANPTWLPSDPTASLFLSRLAAELAHAPSNANAPVGRLASLSTPGAKATSAMPGAHSIVGQAAGGSAAGGVSFTPANSTLAQRSQMYSHAFERSILLAKPSNAAALQASATKTGPRSVPTPMPSSVPSQKHQQQQRHHNRHGSGGAAHRKLQAVDEDQASVLGHSDEADPLDLNGLSVYEDAHPDRLQRSTNANAQNAVDQGQHANLRGLLHHIGTSRW